MTIFIINELTHERRVAVLECRVTKVALQGSMFSRAVGVVDQYPPSPLEGEGRRVRPAWRGCVRLCGAPACRVVKNRAECVNGVDESECARVTQTP